jgi:hypothetical protein
VLAVGLLSLNVFVEAAQDKNPPEQPPKVEPLPFNHKVETYRNHDGSVMAFALRLEQPFLAEEFDKSNFLRLQVLDRNAYLIYPPETKFQQKHAEFFGRLRGEGKAKVRVTYEMISENLDGSRKIVLRQGDLEIDIPKVEGGPQTILRDWANQQNAYFLNLLNYYPQDTFYQYALLQSRERYGVTPPALPKPKLAEQVLEGDLYHVFTGSQAIQEALQRAVLTGNERNGDLNVHISQVGPPNLQSPSYEELLKKKREQKIEPQVLDITRLIPEDQYCLQFNSMEAANGFFDLATEWGNSLLRLFTIQSRDHLVAEKLEDQLCLRRGPLTKLFADSVISELAVTGADPFVVEGSDVTVIFRLKKPELFEAAAATWLDQVKSKYAGLKENTFDYRGHRIQARYTEDRMVSSFSVRHNEFAIYSNSPRAIRKIADTFTGAAPRLLDALDYRYVSTILPPSNEARCGYLFASESFLKHMVGPGEKISEKRRLQCFNNLVMLNNASLLFRMENGSSPNSVTDMSQSRFIDADKLVCPQGGAYSWDTRHDSCTCSVHNRLKYLTPNAEISTLKVSTQEQQQYDRFKQRYEAFWRGLFDPIAMRLTMGPRVKIETCVLPLANGSEYTQLREWVAKKPLPLRTAPIARTAVGSLLAVPGRQANAALLKSIPGIPEVLEADPTLTDLKWVGDRFSVHVCDDDAIVEIDPSQLKALDLFGFKAGVTEQTVVALAVTAMKLPLYVAIDVEDREKAARLLEKLSSKIILKKIDLLNLPTTLDAYRLPDYKDHPIYVLTYQLYALKVRLHVAVVGDQLIAATKAKTLRDAIDSASQKDERKAAEGHLMWRFNRKALDRLTNDVQLYWEEKSRLACHDNIMPIYTLSKLYGVPIAEVNRLAQAKYGVTYHCPDGGAYQYDAGRDQVVCSVHGNRQLSRQSPGTSKESSFTRFLDRLEEITATLRFEEDGLIATVEIARTAPEKK